MNTARLLVPIFTLQDFLYLLLDFLLAGFRNIHGQYTTSLLSLQSIMMILSISNKKFPKLRGFYRQTLLKGISQSPFTSVANQAALIDSEEPNNARFYFRLCDSRIDKFPQTIVSHNNTHRHDFSCHWNHENHEPDDDHLQCFRAGGQFEGQTG